MQQNLNKEILVGGSISSPLFFEWANKNHREGKCNCITICQKGLAIMEEDENVIIARDNLDVKQFNCIAKKDLESYIFSLLESERMFYEIVRDGFGNKLYVDIDMKNDDGKFTEDDFKATKIFIIRKIIDDFDGFCETHRLTKNKSFPITFDSSDETKFSSHMYFPFCSTNLKHLKFYMKELEKEYVQEFSKFDKDLMEKFSKVIDFQIYSGNASLRLEGCHKKNSKRVKKTVFVPEFYKTYESRLITNIDGCKNIDKELETFFNKYRTVSEPKPVCVEDLDEKEMKIVECLKYLPDVYCDKRDEWIKIGFSVANELGDTENSRTIFETWSKQSMNYNEVNFPAEWNSFFYGASKIYGMGYLINRAKENEEYAALHKERIQKNIEKVNPYDQLKKYKDVLKDRLNDLKEAIKEDGYKILQSSDAWDYMKFLTCKDKYSTYFLKEYEEKLLMSTKADKYRFAYEHFSILAEFCFFTIKDGAHTIWFKTKRKGEIIYKEVNEFSRLRDMKIKYKKFVIVKGILKLKVVKTDLYKLILNMCRNGINVFNDSVFIPFGINQTPEEIEKEFYFKQDKVFNRFCGFKGEGNQQIEDQGKLDEYFVMLKDILANGDEESFYYIVRWLASAVQFPKKKLPCMIIKSDKEGIGKSVNVKFWRDYIFGPIHSSAAGIDQILQRFNSFIEDKILVQIDEIDNFKEGFNNIEKFKRLITEQDIQIERKFFESKQVKMYAKYIITTNNENVVKTNKVKDRRFAFFETESQYIERVGKEKFISIFTEELGKDLFFYLANLDLTGFDPEEIPNTNFKKRIMQNSKPITEKFLIDLAEEESGFEFDIDLNEGKISMQHLYSAYCMWHGYMGINIAKLSRYTFSRNIAKYFPISVIRFADKKSRGIKVSKEEIRKLLL